MAVQSQPDHLMRRLGLDDPDHFARGFDGFQAKIAAEIEAARAAGATRFLFTSEHFHSRLKTVEEISKIKAILAPSVARFRVLVYLREQSDVRRSLYSTALKKGYPIAPVAFQSDVDPSWSYYNYEALLNQWAQVFGHAAIVPVIYAPDQFEQGDIRRDFWARLNAETSGKTTDTPPAFPLQDRENDALSLEEAQFAYALNCVMRGPDDTQRAHERRARIMKGLREAQGARSRFTLPNAAQVFDRFLASNSRMAQAFLAHQAAPFQAPQDSYDPSQWAQVAPAQGPRLRAITDQFDLHRDVSADIARFDAQGGSLNDLIVLIHHLLAPPPSSRRGFWQALRLQ